MEFYYPSTGKITYSIIFPWGEYIITTEAKLDSAVHGDSKPYLGYITLRPIIKKSVPNLETPFFIITPRGDVWKNRTGQGIDDVKERQEIIIKKTEHSTQKTTTTIQSVSEPLIDDFKEHPERWKRYGKLDINKGDAKLVIVEE
jgi:hypothetical protein